MFDVLAGAFVLFVDKACLLFTSYACQGMTYVSHVKGFETTGRPSYRGHAGKPGLSLFNKIYLLFGNLLVLAIRESGRVINRLLHIVISRFDASSWSCTSRYQCNVNEY